MNLSFFLRIQKIYNLNFLPTTGTSNDIVQQIDEKLSDLNFEANLVSKQVKYIAVCGCIPIQLQL